MEHLLGEFGGLGLSSSANEWKPQPGPTTSSSSQGVYSQQQQRASEPISRLAVVNQQAQQQLPQPHQQQLQQQQPQHGPRSNTQDWQQQQQQQADSDLKANAVKEFVPGRGWSAQSSTSSVGSGSAGRGELLVFI